MIKNNNFNENLDNNFNENFNEKQLKWVSPKMSEHILKYVNEQAKSPEEKQAMIDDMLSDAITYEKKQNTKQKREGIKQQLREKIATETRWQQSNQLKFQLRTATFSDMIRGFSEKNGGNLSWLDNDEDLLNAFLEKNPNQLKTVEKYLNGDISNVELGKRIGFIKYNETAEDIGITEEKEEWPWFWKQAGQVGKDIVWGVGDSVRWLWNFVWKYAAKGIGRTAKKLWANEDKVDHYVNDFIDYSENFNDIGQDKDSLTYNISNNVADIAQVATPWWITKAGAKGVQLANSSSKIGKLVAKTFPKASKVINKTEKGADFVVWLINKAGGKVDTLTKKAPFIWKILKNWFSGASDMVLFNIVNWEGTDVSDIAIGGGIGGAMPVLWKLWKFIKWGIWNTAAKTELNGLLNPAKLDTVRKALIVDGVKLPGKWTAKDVWKWMLERWFKGDKTKIIEQLWEHANKSKTMVDDLLKLSESKHNISEVSEALTMLADDYATTPWLKGKAKDILKMIKNEYTLSEMNQAKRYMDEAYNMFKMNWGETAWLKSEWLRNIRSTIKNTIENIAKEEWLGNIKMLNNETQVARGLADWIMLKDNADNVRQLLSPFSSWKNWAILWWMWGSYDIKENRLNFDWKNMLLWAMIWGVAWSTKFKTYLANWIKKLWWIEKKEINQYLSSKWASKLSQNSENILRELVEEGVKKWEIGEGFNKVGTTKNALKTFVKQKTTTNALKVDKSPVYVYKNPIFKKAKKVGKGEFWDIYEWVKGAEAEQLLIYNKWWEVKGAYKYKGQDVDLMWGWYNKNSEKWLGLSKIAEKHPEVLGNIQTMLDILPEVHKDAKKIVLSDPNSIVVIRLDWNKKNKRWLMTAYDKK